MTKALGKQRHRLWQENPHCHWCGRLTLLVEGSGKNRGAGFPADAATVEHLRDRWDPRRQERIQPGERRHVIACRECNNRRVTEHQTIEAVRQRSGAYPIGEAVRRLAEAVFRAVLEGRPIEI